jgi:hypothetical protein
MAERWCALAQLRAVVVKVDLTVHLAYARQVFVRVPNPFDVVWYSTLLRGYAWWCMSSSESSSTAAVRGHRPRRH